MGRPPGAQLPARVERTARETACSGMILANPGIRPAPAGGASWLLGRAADRLAARTLAAARLGPDWLAPLHGSWRRPEDICWDCLPRAFLFSASQGPGRRALVPDRPQFRTRELERLARHWLRQAPEARLMAEASPTPGTETWEVLVRGGRARSLRPAGGDWVALARCPVAAQQLAEPAEVVTAGLLQAAVAFRLGGSHPLFVAMRPGALGAD